MRPWFVVALSGAILLAPATPVRGQQRDSMPPGHVHTPGMTHQRPASASREAGQAAFAAIAEVVGILESDPATDWPKVDLERLRRHLVDMDEVTLHSRVEQRGIDGGFEAIVTGVGPTPDAIRRMTRSHAPVLAAETDYRMQVEDVADGVKIRVTAAPGSGPGTVARVRGLGFIGIMASGAHHQAHHLAIARGTGVAGHIH